MGLGVQPVVRYVSGMQQVNDLPAPAGGAESPPTASASVRKVVVTVEEVLLEGGASPAVPARRAAVAVVIANPWARTTPAADLGPAVACIAPELARIVTERLCAALGQAETVEAFGKAAIVGTAGELEHAAALIHTPYFGNLVREYLQGESIICFADTRADAGAALVIPMWHKRAAATRSHYQTITARVSDAPRAEEIVVMAAASTGPRPHPRIGDRTTDPEVTAATVKEPQA